MWNNKLLVKNQICIVIPIYKENLNNFEIQAVKQCIKILSNYQLFFICSKELNNRFYKENFKEIENFMFFDKKYFENIYGYNRLLLSIDFYKKFSKYKYMLVYQTDCYVFKDELLIWANKGYDYIGGIWFENYEDYPNKGAKLWFAGNGGLSLRKIPKIIHILSSKFPLNGIGKLLDERKDPNSKFSKNWFKWSVRLPFRLLGYKNNFNYVSKMHIANEDVFFADASIKYKAIKIPHVKEAIGFSWDRQPAFLFKEYKKLPFACHAWYRNEFPYEGNKDFWLPIICE